MYAVIVDGAVVFRSRSVSQAFSFCEGFGGGEVVEVLAKAQENTSDMTFRSESTPERKPLKSR